MPFQGREIVDILKAAHELGLKRLRVRQGDFSLEYDADGAALGESIAAPVAAAPVEAPRPTTPPPRPAAIAVAPPRAGLVAVASPMPGTFYRRPAPDKPSFVEVGSRVGARDTVCLIEVMKLFNSVPAGLDGVVAEVVVEDAAVVEAGQVLVWIEPMPGGKP